MALSLNNRPDGPNGSYATIPQSVVNVGQATSTEATTPEDGSSSAKITFDTDSIGPMFGIEESTLTIGTGIQLEQTEILNQLKNYHDHLNRLRRINEGDDASDAPGYSLNLGRIPVSVLPGTRSREGYGAEITVTATPQYGPELLPVAYRDFVINDLVDQLAVPLTRFLNDDPRKAANLLQLFENYNKASAEIAEARQVILNNFCMFRGSESIYQKLQRKLAELNSPIYDRDTACFYEARVAELGHAQLAREMAVVVAPAPLLAACI